MVEPNPGKIVTMDKTVSKPPVFGSTMPKPNGGNLGMS
jgi:hypothetical protein